MRGMTMRQIATGSAWVAGVLAFAIGTAATVAGRGGDPAG